MATTIYKDMEESCKQNEKPKKQTQRIHTTCMTPFV